MSIESKAVVKSSFSDWTFREVGSKKYCQRTRLNHSREKDSQGLCFIGKVHLPDFLKQKLAPKTGPIVEITADHSKFVQRQEEISSASELDALRIDAVPFHYEMEDGKQIGKHMGAHYFTPGQRKGIGVGGTKEALFVLEKDVKNNILFVGQASSHPGLHRSVLKIQNSDEHWLRSDLKIKAGETLNVEARIRYRQHLVPSVLHRIDSELYIYFSESQNGIAGGQFAAWYIGDELIGSGVIHA